LVAQYIFSSSAMIAQAAEVAQLDDPALALIDAGEGLERVVEGDQLASLA
jgi:hypothetical protein